LPTAYDRPPTHRAGIFRPELLDQGQLWIDERGREHRVEELQYDHACNLVLYLLNGAPGFIGRHATTIDITGCFGDDLPPQARPPSSEHEAKRRMMKMPLMKHILHRILQ
jgi:hypothetical protein